MLANDSIPFAINPASLPSVPVADISAAGLHTTVVARDTSRHFPVVEEHTPVRRVRYPKALPDSVAGPREASLHKPDTAHFDFVPLLARMESLDSLQEQASVDTLAADTVPAASPPQWLSGKIGDTRPIFIGDNSGVLAIVTGMCLLMMLSYRHCRRLFSTLWQEMWWMKKKPNVFDEHTSSETRVIALMALQWSMCIGLLLYSAVPLIDGIPVTEGKAFPDTLRLIFLSAGYFVAQFLVYMLLGYTFTSSERRNHLVQGFTATQSLLGFALLIPALVSIFYPPVADIMVMCGAALYLMARLIFISKGFRIFYTNFGSLFYFILYLCTIEILPIIIVYKIAASLIA